ncbi:MAG: hypothetical protein JNL08_06780 [Planctomycetes bacterium]|nr:hypothetical protein [Planctomycetota bacterium]
MRSEVRCAAALVLGLGGLAAQAAVVPGPMAGIEGGGGTSIPFGSNLSCRYQVLYDVQELPWTGPRVITGISLRPDANTTGVAVPPKGFLDVSILVSTTSRTSTTMSAVFEDNYSTDATWVVSHRSVQLPGQPAVGAGPMPANVQFAFDVPWAYALLPYVGDSLPENLLLEIWIHAQPSGAYRIDNLSSCTAPITVFGNLDTATCAPPGGTAVGITSDVSMLAGSSYSWHVSGAPANTVFLLAMNLTNTDGLLGQSFWPLPYPMFDPANPALPSPALTVLGWPAPGCWINVNPVVWLTGVIDAAGNGTATGVVPPGRDSVGDTYYAQAFVYAPTANPLRLITSLGRGATVCGPLGVTRNYAFYNPIATPPQPVPTSGALQYGVGPVIEVW